jgi:peptide/nickel transport system permease protein
MTRLAAIAIRLLKLLSVVLIVSFLTFALTQALPGDPVNAILGPQASDEELRAAVTERYGLDEPFLQQYIGYLGNVLQGDLGRSYTSGFDTTYLLSQALPPSLQLMIMAQVISLMISIPLAMLSAYRANSKLDQTITAGAFGTISFPNYALAVVLVAVFAVNLGWFPATNYVKLTSDMPASIYENLKSLFLPAVTLAAAETAVYLRLLRTDMIATLQEDYITMAKAKGMPNRRILMRHAFRPSTFSLVTVAGLNMGRLIGGTLIIEVIFALNGLGSYLVAAIFRRDYIAVQGAVVVIAVGYVLINFIVDMLYAVIDPRVRHARAIA